MCLVICTVGSKEIQQCIQKAEPHLIIPTSSLLASQPLHTQPPLLASEFSLQPKLDLLFSLTDKIFQNVSTHSHLNWIIFPKYS
jgi:hypothetical protein